MSRKELNNKYVNKLFIIRDTVYRVNDETLESVGFYYGSNNCRAVSPGAFLSLFFMKVIRWELDEYPGNDYN